MSYSKWLKMDLHIHSHESKRTKSNDYDGENLTFDKLINALEKEKVNLFSITDHNTINTKLYKELLEKRDLITSKNINFIIGAELDFYDVEVHDKVFHMLTFFDTNDLDKIASVLAKLFQKNSNEEIDQNVLPIDLKTFFKETFSSGIKNLITIPHFNQKDKGIPANHIDKFVYTVFNALEDSNNRNRLVKSITNFKNHNYTDVPVVVFSDNHNIDIYPCGKDKNRDKQTAMHILGNLRYPFGSVKAAFQDITTRISIENTDTRSINYKNKYIKSIKLDEMIINFSPYQNSIIGGFGTGKSFLLDLIINGKSNVNLDKYKDLVSNYNDFSIIFSDDTKRSSLNEVKDEVKIIRFNQYKDIYFKNKLYDEEKKLLESNLHIEFPILNSIEQEDSSSLIDCFNNLETNLKNSSSITDIINYEALSRSSEKEYSFKNEVFNNIYQKPDYFDEIQANLDSELNRNILNLEFYNTFEKEKLRNTNNLIVNKNNKYSDLSEEINEILEILNASILVTNKSVSDRNSLISSNLKIWDSIKEDVLEYSNLLKLLEIESNEFEETFSTSKYNLYKNHSKDLDFHSYKLSAKYDAQNEKPNFFSEIFKQSYRENSVFKSILSTIKNGESFTQSSTFEIRVEKYIEKFYSNFNKICYDIFDEDLSILNKSAGERANIIINLIFNIIEDNSENNISSIVILDQPEDNLDNKGIQTEVVDRIRAMKQKNCLPQLICVTHNANISITADSENIIVANKISQKSSYNNSGIEDSDFVKNVCNTVEGGIIALRKRGIKFNIPMIKEVELEE